MLRGRRSSVRGATRPLTADGQPSSVVSVLGPYSIALVPDVTPRRRIRLKQGASVLPFEQRRPYPAAPPSSGWTAKNLAKPRLRCGWKMDPGMFESTHGQPESTFNHSTGADPFTQT